MLGTHVTAAAGSSRRLLSIGVASLVGLTMLASNSWAASAPTVKGFRDIYCYGVTGGENPNRYHLTGLSISLWDSGPDNPDIPSGYQAIKIDGRAEKETWTDSGYVVESSRRASWGDERNYQAYYAVPPSKQAAQICLWVTGMPLSD